ncbi:MAG: ABC transporter permease, partial [Acidimicrobiales bacterium]
TFALFAPEAAQRLLAEPGKIDAIGVVAEDGVSQREVRDRIAAEMPDGIEVLTGVDITEETQTDIAEALSFFTIFLGVFAGVAIVVSVFSIYNTFSIIVAQRTREMALLRAVGAARRQVLSSVLGEALVIGILASALGLAGGVVMVGILKGLLAGFGFDLPAGGVVLKASTVIVALVVGISVTLLSAIAPAVRASRVPPLAALRDVAVDRAARSRGRLVLGVVITAIGIAITFSSATSAGGDNALFAAGGGVLLVLIGTIVLGPVVARPLGRLIGAPVTRLRGITGHLAQENAARNPKRTANTAAALLIGVGVVGFFTVLSASLQHSFKSVLDRTVTGDFVIDSGTFGVGGFGPELVEKLNDVPEVETATGLKYFVADVNGDNEFVSAVDPATFSEVVDLETVEGSIADLGADGIAVHADTADDEGLALGDTATVRFPQTGEQTFRVVALYDRNELANNWLVGTKAAEANLPDQFVAQVYVTLADGVSPDGGRAAIEEVAAAYANADVQDQKEFRDSQASQINQILYLVYAMLAFAIIIALMGIANTLSLSVHERTRELGLLRAVGMTRGQLRSSVRWESAIIAVFGTLGGLGIAVFFGWIAITAADEELLNFQFPAISLAVIVLVAALAGVAAAFVPAWRAARLDVLQAIATE